MSAKTRGMVVRRLEPALVLLIAIFVSFSHLGRTPVYLGGDEAEFGVHAQAIASTGCDLNGRCLPLFFNLTDPAGDQNTVVAHRWYQPVLFYLIAAVLTVAPLSEASVRAPTAFIGAVDVLLIYAVARKVFSDRLGPLASAGVLVLSPAHVLLTRQATDYICSLPFVLGWLWCLLASAESGSIALSFAGGLLLGFGFYSYLAAWVMMPVYLVLTWIAQRSWNLKWPRSAIASGVGFLLPILPAITGLAWHPQMMRDTIDRYSPTLFHGAAGFLRFGVVRDRVSVYWDYFDPAFLFLTGGATLTTATLRAGVFLLPAAAFLPAGLYALWTRRHAGRASLILLTAFLTAPLAATLVGERYMIQRDAFVLPFGALAAAAGFVSLFRHERRAIRAMAWILVVLMPLQFAVFARDYFTAYRHRSSVFFDSGNFRELAEYLIAADSSRQVPTVRLSRQLDEASARWRFYLTKHRRQDLLPRTYYFDADGLDQADAPVDSLMAMYADEHRIAGVLATGKWSVERTIVNIDGDAASVVLRKRTP